MQPRSWDLFHSHPLFFPLQEKNRPRNRPCERVCLYTTKLAKLAEQEGQQPFMKHDLSRHKSPSCFFLTYSHV